MSDALRLDVENKTEEIWKGCVRNLRAFILSRVSSPHDADDILQDVFLKIHSKIDTLKNQDLYCPWVFKIARNAINDFYRKSKNGESVDQLKFEQQFGENPSDAIVEGLRDMVELLPEKYAEALNYVEFEGLTQIEYAKRKGMSISAAKSRVQRGRALLRQVLLDCCQYEFDQFGSIIDYRPNCTNKAVE